MLAYKDESPGYASSVRRSFLETVSTGSGSDLVNDGDRERYRMLITDQVASKLHSPIFEAKLRHDS
jgi:hypothetical protein